MDITVDNRVLWIMWSTGLLFLGTAFYGSIIMSGSWGGPKNLEHGEAFLPRRIVPPPSQEMTITIFTAPAPLLGSVGVRQKLAIASWLRLKPRPRVVLLGKHPSLAEFAAKNSSHVSVEDDIDFTFSGEAMFHGMVRRARRTPSGVVVMIDPELILLPHVSLALGSMYDLDHDWLLTALPRTVNDLPYSLRDDWVQTDGFEVEDAKVEAYVKEKGTWTIGGVAQLWAWNANQQPLHAGIMPPFVYKQGQHDPWLLAEALASKYRVLFDGTEALSVFRTLNSLSSTGPISLKNQDEANRFMKSKGNIDLASSYGSFHFRPSKFSDISYKLVICGGSKLKAFCIVNLSHQPCLCSALRPPAIVEEKSAIVGARKNVRWSPWLDLLHRTDVKLNPSSLGESGSAADEDSWTEKMIRLLKGDTSSSPQVADCGCKSQSSRRRVLIQKPSSFVLPKTQVIPNSLESLVRKQASSENVIILAVVGNSYRDMLMNWVCRLKYLGISNFVVVAIDEDIYRFAVQQGLPVFKSSLDMSVSRDDCHFGTECFQKVTKMKSRSVLKVLELGYHVLFSDVDVYWFQDPSKELMAFGPGHLTAQSDQWNETAPLNQPRRLNSGFYFAWSEKNTIAAFSKIVKHAATSEMSEQPSFYDVLCGYRGIYAVGDDLCIQPQLNVTVHFLDPMKYPNGAFRRLWEKEDVRGACEAQGCRVLHNNWVNGRKKKLERQLSAGLWDYDSDNRMCSRSWNKGTANPHA